MIGIILNQTKKTVFNEGDLELIPVAKMLVKDGLLRQTDLNALVSIVSSIDPFSKHPFIMIADQGFINLSKPGHFINMKVLMNWFSEKVGMPIAQIDPLKIDVASVTSVVTFAYASKHQLLAIKVTHDSVLFACSNPCQNQWVGELSRILGKSIECCLISPEDLERYQLEFYALSRSTIGAKKQQDQKQQSGIQNLEQLMELGRSGKLDADDQHVVSIVDWLLQYSFEQRASDIHLEPRREISTVRFRIDGVLHDVYDMPSAVMMAVVSRLKSLGRMDVAERRRPQDGRIKSVSPDGQEIELRLSSMPVALGEKLVMRIFDPEVLLRDMVALGFDQRDRLQWKSMLEKNAGIVLVTGPTGSGKTTTLYSSLKKLASSHINVCTLEDPIELVEPAFNQMQVNPSIDLSFSTGIKTLLRQDPDIIMVGEIRDKDTAHMAIQAALTGHLVLSTLHTNDAVSSVTRLLELGVPEYLISSTLIGVLAQRLVRMLCPNCKQAMNVEASEWAEFLHPWSAPVPATIYQANGCLECRNTGFLGRSGLYEMLVIDQPFRQALKDKKSLDELRKIAFKQGMRPMLLNGALKVAAGTTTYKEVLKVAPSPLGSL